MKDFLTFKFLRNDLFGGLTAGIVALPLALAFGEQSGLGAAAGLYGAAFIAFFASLFGGTPTQISGPTAPMTAVSMTVVAGILQAFQGKMDEALPVILGVFLLAGLFQIALGVIKVGSYIKYIPQTVVSGFMTGIGVIILITQLLPAVGYYTADDRNVVEQFKPAAESAILNRIIQEEAEDKFLVLENQEETYNRIQQVNPEEIAIEANLLAKNDSKGVIGSLRYIPKALANIQWLELILALATILIIYGFKKITTAIPSTLVALAAVSLVAYFGGFEYKAISAIPSQLPAINYEIITGFNLRAFTPFIFTALGLALLGAIDSLLTSVVADNMTRTQHNSNQELVGQGIGNSVAAFFGGLPGAGATIRTVVNIQAGGKTKLSGMLAGVLLLIILLLLGPIASKIPAAVLAGILITVGFGVMDTKGLKALPKMDKADAVILLTVLLVTVFYDLIAAVGLGLVMSAIVFMGRMSNLGQARLYTRDLGELADANDEWEDERKLPDLVKEKVIFKHLEGPLFFGMSQDFKALVAGIENVNLIVFRMEKVPFVDQSGIYALEVAIDELHKADVIVAMSGANPEVLEDLKSLHIIPKHLPGHYVFEEFEDCRRWLSEVLQSEDGLAKQLDDLHDWLKKS